MEIKPPRKSIATPNAASPLLTAIVKTKASHGTPIGNNAATTAKLKTYRNTIVRSAADLRNQIIRRGGRSAPRPLRDMARPAGIRAQNKSLRRGRIRPVSPPRKPLRFDPGPRWGRPHKPQQLFRRQGQAPPQP